MPISALRWSRTMIADIEIRECTTAEEFDGCIALQRETFGLPELEISPRRHFVVTMHAGGWALGAFAGMRLVGFVLSVPGFRSAGRMFYSHMAAVSREFQNHGIGARLKWAQRERALAEGVDFIKWTFQPPHARNAFFNLERLGAVVREYKPNFYGTDYATVPNQSTSGFDSDRLFADWELNSDKVLALAQGESFSPTGEPARTISIPGDWNALLSSDADAARRELLRIRTEFQAAFSAGFVCRKFRRDAYNPQYLLFASKA
jgi:predicted GNAT superfamily acetyltransferase